MATRDYIGRKFAVEAVNKTVDSLAIEEPLQININGNPFTVTMRTPGNDVNLVRGLLHSEGILRDVNFQPDIIPIKGNNKDIVTLVDLFANWAGRGCNNTSLLIFPANSLE